MTTKKPVNQKSLYHSYSDLYEKIMNDEIPLDKAEKACKALDGMNRTYFGELKRAEIELQLKGHTQTTSIRTLELKEFDEIPISDSKAKE